MSGVAVSANERSNCACLRSGVGSMPAARLDEDDAVPVISGVGRVSGRTSRYSCCICRRFGVDSMVVESLDEAGTDVVLSTASTYRRFGAGSVTADGLDEDDAVPVISGVGRVSCRTYRDPVHRRFSVDSIGVD